jgi:hypothetical protein
MRSARSAWIICLYFLAVPVWSQQAQIPAPQPQPITPQQTQPVAILPPATKDPLAVSVLNQSLSGAGGALAIKAVADYTATGNIIYHWNPEVQGGVTVRGLGLGQLRVDANLPRGMHSSVISGGQTSTKAEDGAVSQYPPPYPVPSSDAFPYQPPMFPGSLVLPHTQLAAVLNDPLFSISDKGVVQIDGHAVHDIQAQMVFPGQTQPDNMAEYQIIDFFIDTSTIQLVMIQDNVPKHIVHQIRYSDYKTVSGVLVPFSIGEEMGGQKTREIRLDQASFNTGLQDAEFSLR